MSYAMAQTSLAHTYGNVASYISEYIKNLFPKNYFPSVIINTAIPYKQLDRFRNSEEEYFRREYPQLIIRPRVDFNESETFLYNTFLTTRITDNYMDTCYTNLQPFAYDKERGNCMKFLLNRLKISFEVTIIVETMIEQINQAHFLKNVIRQNRPFFLSTFLESFIPRELLELMGKDIGIPLYDENGSVKPFLDYINSISEYPISYKMKNASGNDEFFRFYPVNIDTTFNDLNMESGSDKKGWVDYSHNITFTVSTEFNASGLYYYFAKNSDLVDKFTAAIKEEHSDSIIPFLTIENVYTNRYADGWNLYTAPIFMVDKDARVDIMDIEPLFNNSMKHIIEYHNKHGIPRSVYMKVFVVKGTDTLVEPVDYELDLEGYRLVTKKVDPDATYRLIIHVNTIYINNLIKELYKLDEEL